MFLSDNPIGLQSAYERVLKTSRYNTRAELDRFIGWDRKTREKHLEGKHRGELRLRHIFKLAELLKVSPHGIVRSISSATVSPDLNAAMELATFSAANEQYRDCYQRCDYWSALSVAATAGVLAATDEERARSCVFRHAALKEVGLPGDAALAIEEGLAFKDASLLTRAQLFANLSHSRESAGAYFDAMAYADDALTLVKEYFASDVEDCAESEVLQRRAEDVQALAHLCQGRAMTALVELERRPRSLARKAVKALRLAAQQYQSLSQRYDRPSHQWIANTCRAEIHAATVAGIDDAEKRLAAADEAVASILAEMPGAEADVSKCCEHELASWCRHAVTAVRLIVRHLPRSTENASRLEDLTDAARKWFLNVGDWNLKADVLDCVVEQARIESAMLGCRLDLTVTTEEYEMANLLAIALPEFDVTPFENANVIEVRSKAMY